MSWLLWSLDFRLLFTEIKNQFDLAGGFSQVPGDFDRRKSGISQFINHAMSCLKVVFVRCFRLPFTALPAQTVHHGNSSISITNSRFQFGEACINLRTDSP